MDFITVSLDDASNNLLRKKFDEFEKDFREAVNLQQYDWDNIWRELVNVGIYGHGADLAEIGSTWLESLVAMNALVPFSQKEFAFIGGKQAFFPASWQNVFSAYDNNIWGVPSRLDVRVIFYWRDMFETAGVDAEQAFSSTETIRDAFLELQRVIAHPWGVVTTKSAHNSIHNVSSWVWESGGEFVTDDGKKLSISTNATRHGLRKYFDLFAFMPPECRNCSVLEASELFASRKIAATIAGPELIGNLKQAGLPKDMISRVGVTSPPGPSFVGGTVLVRWKHSRKTDLAWELIKRLSEKDFNIEFSETTNLLPIRQEAWTDEFQSQDERLPAYLKGILGGRGLPIVPLWGMIEDRLATTLGNIWEEIYSIQGPLKHGELDSILSKHFEPLAVRLEMALNKN